MKNVNLNFTFKEKDFCLCATVTGTTKRHYKKVDELINPNFNYWDKKQQRFNEATQDAIHNNAVLQTMHAKYQRLIDTFNPTTGKELFAMSETASKVDAKRELTFGEYIQQYIDREKHRPVKKPSKAYQPYINLLHKLEFEGNVINVPLSEIANKHFIQFGNFILSLPNDKGRTNYKAIMSYFKAVHNKARNNELNDNELRYDFRTYAPTRVEKEITALTVEQYQQFVNLDLSKIPQSGVKPEYYKELYHDFCMFQYEMKSRPVDCVRLNHSDIVAYKGKYCIKYIAEKMKNKCKATVNLITPTAQSIIDKYKGKSSKGYVFPFAINEVDWNFDDPDNWNKWNNKKAKQLEKVNHFLKQVAGVLGVERDALYNYIFRHTTFTHEIEKNNKSLLTIAKEGGTSIDMLGKNYYNYISQIV
jgi:integrase